MLAHKLRWLSVVAVVAMAASMQVAVAAVTQYDRATWDTMVTVAGGTDFEGIAPAGGSQDYDTNTDLVLGGMTFHGYYSDGTGPAFASNGLSVVDPGLSYGGEPVFDWGSGAVLFALADYALSGASGSAKVILPDGVNAVAFDVMGYLTDTSFHWTGYGMTILVQLYKGDNTADNLLQSFAVPAVQRPGRTMVGFISDSDPIKTIVLAPEAPDIYTYAYPLYDNFAYGTVPEPSTVALLVAGAAWLGTHRRGAHR